MTQVDEAKKKNQVVKELSEEEIRDAFERLGLNNPQYVEYLKSFSLPTPAEDVPRYWYGADSGTSLINVGKTDA